MNRQKLLNRVAMALDGKGRALGRVVAPREGDNGDDSCRYILSNHPGCAIGCQWGFRTKFRGKIKEGQTIEGLLELTPGLAEFFGISPDKKQRSEDIGFLRNLQSLHDAPENWRDKFWKRQELKRFAERYKLVAPKFPKKEKT